MSEQTVESLFDYLESEYRRRKGTGPGFPLAGTVEDFLAEARKIWADNPPSSVFYPAAGLAVRLADSTVVLLTDAASAVDTGQILAAGDVPVTTDNRQHGSGR